MSNENSENQDNRQKRYPYLKRWIMGLCIFSAIGFLYNEVYSGWFSSYTVFIFGLEYKDWARIAATSSILGAVLYLLYGVISDNLRTKLGRRIPLILVGSISSAILSILYTIGDSYVWLFINAGILLSITRNMLTVGRSLTADLIPQEKRGRVNTLLSIMTNIGSIIIWIPTLILIPEGGGYFSKEIHEAFIIIGSLMLAFMGIICAILIKEPPVLDKPQKILDSLKKIFDWKEMKSNKNFVRIFTANLFLAAADAAIFTYFLPLIENIEFNMDQVLIYGPFVGIAIGLGMYFLGKATDKIGRKFTTTIGFIVAPFGSWILALKNGDMLFLMIGFAIFLPFYLGGYAAVESWMQDILPKESRGRFFGLINITSAIGAAVGTWVGASLADAFNIFWVFVAAAIILWTSIPFFLRVPETLNKKNR